jgi:hypothetical protein
MWATERLSESCERNYRALRIPHFEGVFEFLGRARSRLADTLSAFGVMWPEFYREALDVQPPKRAPLGPDFAAYVLIEMTGSDPQLERPLYKSVVEQALGGNHRRCGHRAVDRRGTAALADSRCVR